MHVEGNSLVFTGRHNLTHASRLKTRYSQKIALSMQMQRWVISAAQLTTDIYIIFAAKEKASNYKKTPPATDMTQQITDTAEGFPKAAATAVSLWESFGENLEGKERQKRHFLWPLCKNQTHLFVSLSVWMNKWARLGVGPRIGYSQSASSKSIDTLWSSINTHKSSVCTQACTHMHVIPHKWKWWLCITDKSHWLR